MPSSNGVRFALVIAAISLAFLAQTMLPAGRPLWASALFLAAIAAFTFAATDTPGAVRWVKRTLGRQRMNQTIRLRTSAWSLETRIGAVCAALCVACILASLAAFYSGPPNTAGWAMFGVSAILMLAAVPTIDGRWTLMASTLRSGRPFALTAGALYEAAALIGVLLLALAIRLHDLRELPVGLWYDEAANLSVAASIALDPGSAPVFATTLPTLYLLPVAALTTLLGTTPEALRLVSVAFSLAGIAAVHLLGRHLAGPLVGLTSAFVLAVMRWDINFGRIGMHGVTMSLFTALTAWLTLCAVRSGRLSDYGFAGAALGLGMWFYAAFRLFPLVVAVILLYGVLSERPALRQLAARLVVFGFAALVMAAPLAQYAVLEPAEFFDRTRASSVFSIAPAGEVIGDVVDNLRAHVLMFNVEGDSNPRHNLPGAAMLDGLSAALLVLGVAVCLLCWSRTALVILPIWLGLMLIPGVLTIPWEAPQALRAIGVLPAVAVLVALAVYALWQAGRASPWTLTRRLTPVACCALLALIALLNVGRYFGEQASDPRVYAAFSTDETLIGRDMLRQQARAYTLFTSRQFKHSLAIDLAANGPDYATLRAPQEVPIDAGKVGLGAAVYVEPREEAVYRLLKLYYPDAAFREVRPPGGGEPMFYVAEISREHLLSRQGLDAVYALDGGESVSKARRSAEAAWALEVGADTPPFEFVWTGALHVTEPGEYGLALESAETVEVLLNGLPVISGERVETSIRPAVGLHALEVKGRVTYGSGTLRLLWRPPGSEWSTIPESHLFRGDVRSYGLAGRFYAMEGESETYNASRVTPYMQPFWYDPVTLEPSRAVWEGVLDAPADGDYGFTLSAEGELTLSIDGDVVARVPSDEDTPHSAVVPLAGGPHRVRVEYVSQYPPSQFTIRWTPAGGEYEPLPIERLTPAPELMLGP